MTNQMREQFEAAVIKRMKEGGFLEVEIRVECLGRSGEGYDDPSVDTYWHYFKESRAVLVVELPKPCDKESGIYVYAENGPVFHKYDVIEAIEAVGLQVKP